MLNRTKVLRSRTVTTGKNQTSLRLIQTFPLGREGLWIFDLRRPAQNLVWNPVARVSPHCDFEIPLAVENML
jgi:hypothetical protein